MAITEDILERCRHCCLAAHQTLITWAEGKVIDPSAVTIRRRAAAISGEASFALLRRAFITPLDREDIWTLRQLSEQLWCETENTALRAQSAQERCSPSILQKTADCCYALHAAFERFPYPFNTAPAQTAIEDARYRLLREKPTALSDGLLRVTKGCENLLFLLQYTLLKNG